MGMFSFKSLFSPVKTLVNPLSNGLPDIGGNLGKFGDNQFGLGDNKRRGLFDPLGTKQAKDMAQTDAETARAFEERRQANITAGTQKVNDAFAQYDDPYFEGIAKTYVDHYTPDLEQQFGEAKRALTLSAPTTGSSAYARSLGLLSRDYNKESVAIKSRAQQAADSARANVQNTRLGLIDSVNNGLGLAEAGNLATERKRLVSAPLAYEALPDVFSRALSGYTNTQIAKQAGYTPNLPLLFGSRGNTQTV
jgi:hypothetical protein